eukprot:CAMPEP_0117686494 /NCGR_PEP_ID=MMETSP0804-20121206/22487_1 /TAXON_ID=1074897 /ORGANISM="Tetraselmis astigmatica, Strain CCMP880" /LENGTH=30 /DNA_ID= /DNA_START= /DNA_END= /DNA_ORIENTATION=
MHAPAQAQDAPSPPLDLFLCLRLLLTAAFP